MRLHERQARRIRRKRPTSACGSSSSFVFYFFRFYFARGAPPARVRGAQAEGFRRRSGLGASRRGESIVPSAFD